MENRAAPLLTFADLALRVLRWKDNSGRSSVGNVVPFEIIMNHNQSHSCLELWKLLRTWILAFLGWSVSNGQSGIRLLSKNYELNKFKNLYQTITFINFIDWNWLFCLALNMSNNNNIKNIIVTLNQLNSLNLNYLIQFWSSICPLNQTS